MNRETSTSPSASQRLAGAGIDDPPSVWADFLERARPRRGSDRPAVHPGKDRSPDRGRVDRRGRVGDRIAARLELLFRRGAAPAAGRQSTASRPSASRIEEAPEGRRKAQSPQLAAIWIDWDPAKSYVDDDDAIGHREEFLIALETIAPCHPHLIVWSGAGFHCYWLAEEPADLSTPEAVACVEGILKGLARYAKTDPATTDASRILRVPATINWPGEHKRALGRRPSVAAIYRPDNGGRL